MCGRREPVFRQCGMRCQRVETLMPVPQLHRVFLTCCQLIGDTRDQLFEATNDGTVAVDDDGSRPAPQCGIRQ